MVDDDHRVVDGVRRTFHKKFEISTALSGKEGLALGEGQSPFAVVIADFQMPEMDGVTFLSRVKQASPDPVRVMFTGQADVEATIAAINEGDVFRFLSKPCPPAVLADTFQAGIEQYHLIASERELLEQTLAGSAEVLVEVLGLVDPATQSVSRQLRDRVVRVARLMKLENVWELELASRLSQLGAVGLPTELLAKHRVGAALDVAEQSMIDQHPQSAYNLLAKIPRLERVGRMILAQASPPVRRPQRTTRPDDDDAVAIGAHLLDLVSRYERSVASGMAPQEAIALLRGSEGPRFRARAVDVLQEVVGESVHYEAKLVRLGDLEERMLLSEDLLTLKGTLLRSAKQEIARAHIEQFNRFQESVGLVQPIRVLVPAPR